MFIVFEGIDGCGKDTQISLLKKKLEDSGEEVAVYSNIDTGPLGDVIREMLDPDNGTYSGNFHLANLIICNMVITHKNIKKDLEAGKIVLCSRWTLSSLVYGCKEFKDNAYEALLATIDIVDIEPDMYVYLDVSPKEAIRRVSARGDKAERYDNLDKLNKLSEIYNSALSEKTSYTHKWVVRIDGEMPQEAVSKYILSYMLYHKR